MEFFIFETRAKQLNIQYPKDIIRQKYFSGDCSLFPMDVKHLKKIFHTATNAIIDPDTLYNCIMQVSKETDISPVWIIENGLTDKKLYIIKDKDKYTLVDRGIKLKSGELNSLKKIVLFGSDL